MRENNVDISLVLPIATNVKQSTTINNFAASINGIDGIYSLGSLHPMQSDWESVLYDIKKRAKGIKLHPEYQQFYIDSKESIQILKKCEELDLITVLHSGKDIGIDPPVHCTPEGFLTFLTTLGRQNRCRTFGRLEVMGRCRKIPCRHTDIFRHSLYA